MAPLSCVHFIRPSRTSQRLHQFLRFRAIVWAGRTEGPVGGRQHQERRAHLFSVRHGTARQGRRPGRLHQYLQVEVLLSHQVTESPVCARRRGVGTPTDDSNKLLVTWKGLYKVLHCKNKVNYLIEEAKGFKWYHANLLKSITAGHRSTMLTCWTSHPGWIPSISYTAILQA